jgi:carbon monoxide dehydrogenase subunit G
MALNIEETFEVEATIEAVWAFMLDPHAVARCMPGAELGDVVDERTFEGTIKVKVGAVTTSYAGRVQFLEVDEAARHVSMTAEGKETGGGTAAGTMSSQLTVLDDGRVQVVAEASVDLTGRVAQVGRGLIQGVSHQLFLQFVECAKQSLEAVEGEEPAEAPENKGPVNILPVILRAIWSGIAGFFRRLFRRSRD